MDEAGTKLVDNVRCDAWRLMWGEYKRKTWLLVIITLPFLFIIPPLPFFVLAVRWAVIAAKLEREFMGQFAATHGLRYEERAPADSVSGRLFSAGDRKKVSNVFLGTLDAHPLRLFHYQYIEGSGDSSITYQFTVCELAFEKTQFPHILLLAPTMPVRYGSVNRWGSDKDVRVPLEGDAYKNFALYTDQGYEIEALQIFSPEVLTFLHEHAKNFSIECAGNKIYLYDDEQILTRSKLDELYRVARSIFEKLAPLLDRLHNDFAALHPYYKKKD